MSEDDQKIPEEEVAEKPPLEAPGVAPEDDVGPEAPMVPDAPEPAEADAETPELAPEEPLAEMEAPEPPELPEITVETPELAEMNEPAVDEPVGIEPVPEQAEPPDSEITDIAPMFPEEAREAGLMPVEGGLPEPKAPEKPAERRGPQPGMSLEARTTDWIAGGKKGPRPGRAAEDYTAGEYAQHPEPEIDEEAGRGPGMVPSDPFGLEDKPAPAEPAAPGMGSTDALITAIQKGNELTEKLSEQAGDIMTMLGDIQEAIENINVGLT